jgi:hypothetical protein
VAAFHSEIRVDEDEDGEENNVGKIGVCVKFLRRSAILATKKSLKLVARPEVDWVDGSFFSEILPNEELSFFHSDLLEFEKSHNSSERYRRLISSS